LEEFVTYEIPDLVILHGDPQDQELIENLSRIKGDPWLDSVGFVLITPRRYTDEELQPLHNFNIMYFLPQVNLSKELPRILYILDQDNQLLNYSGIIKNITDLSGMLELNNDLIQVHFYSNYFSNYLYKEGLIDIGKKYSVQLALNELLNNAIEHGNAGISKEDKAHYLAKGQNWNEVVKSFVSKPENRNKRVQLSYKIGSDKTIFTVKDDGQGFDTSLLQKKAAKGDPIAPNGRGILLTLNSVDHVTYNTRGNKVTVTIHHNGRGMREIPQGFADQQEIHVNPGDQVFAEMESSDSLYYIVSGRYKVLVKEKEVARLNPRDIFLGEMSFLLGNRRTATVVAQTKGTLIKIDRQAFTEVIKEKPNYSIFLSKLLAKRLKMANQQIVHFQNQASGLCVE